MTSPHDDEIVRSLLEEDIPALERALAAGWDIDRPMPQPDGWASPPINIALQRQKQRVIDFLLARGAHLNFQLDHPLIWAIGNGCAASTIEKLVAHGARLDATNQVDNGAYQAALSAKRFDLLPMLVNLGLPVGADGGPLLRSAVFNRQFEVVKFLVEHGYDVNMRRPDMVFSGNPSAVAIAARNGDIETVRYLVEHGADVTLTDEYGDRPYTCAMKAGKPDLVEYIKSLEPAEWHTEEHHLRRVAAYEPPADLVEFLRRPVRRVDLHVGGWHPKYLEFHQLAHVKELDWKGAKLLDLLAVAEGYWETGYLVWSSRHRKLGHADYEHGRFMVLCTWRNFMADPSRWIARLPT